MIDDDEAVTWKLPRRERDFGSATIRMTGAELDEALGLTPDDEAPTEVRRRPPVA
ncbi:MAG: hypothetical protein JNL38_11550 [Myxococcales bacterium]|jgi:hypothetical protein|nr:hypothetical protein [Myxococcales bacterium]